MSRENETDTAAKRPRPTRAQRLAVLGFLAAFALTIITVLWTFHEVRSPDAGRASEPAAAGGKTPPGPAR